MSTKKQSIDFAGITPPHNEQAEKSVLGSLAMCEDYKLVLPTLKRLRPEHFHFETHRKVYQAMQAMTESNLPIDIVTISHVLKTKGWYRDIGMSRLLDILEYTPHAYHLEHYANIVIEHWSRRRMLDAAVYLVKRSVSMTADPTETWEAVGKEVAKHTRSK